MQGKTMRKTFVHATDAQATAIGFVIVLGILLAATSLYLGFNVPKWTAEYEFAHESKVSQDFSDLSAAIDMAIVSEDPTASSSAVIGMEPERVQLVGLFATGGTLQFDPENERFACIAALPNDTAMNVSGDSWNSTAVNDDFSAYDKFHVATSSEGAKLALELKEDRVYDSGGNVSLGGEFWCTNFSVMNGTTLNTHMLLIHAAVITIGPNSSIKADAGGFAGGKLLVARPPISEPGDGPGGGQPASSSNNYSTGGGGAGHNNTGGLGGGAYTSSGWRAGGQGGITYGNATNITTADIGSGGACGMSGSATTAGYFEGGFGGNGGGAIFLDAPLIIVQGTVSANGEEGHYSRDDDLAMDSAGGGGGGGSGGTVLLKGGNITISGNLSARGGNGADGARSCDKTSVYDNNGGGGGGGSGGRIKIFYGAPLAPSDWVAHVNVSGGAGGKGGVGRRQGCSDPTIPNPGGNGTAGGTGSICNISIEYAESIPHYPSGYLISNVTATRGSIGYNVSDTSLIRYGTMMWGEEMPSGTNIALKVRTSMNASMTDALPWEYCPEVTKGQNIADLPSVSDGHQYIQWRAELVTMDRSRTPTLTWVNISYEYGLPILMNASGNIEFGSQYLYHPDYKLIYEHGAIINEPSQGKEFMLLPPPIIIAQDANNCTSLKISALNLTGNESSTSGAFSSSIDAYYQSSALRKGSSTGGLPYHNLTLALTTEHLTAWQDWFNDTCKDAGLTYSMTTAGDYYFNETGNTTLNVIFTGNESKPVYLWLKYAEARIEIPKLPKQE